MTDTAKLRDILAFVEDITENWWSHCDIEASELFDLLQRHNLIAPIPGGFDPEKHCDEYGDAEPGDDWYFTRPLPTPNATIDDALTALREAAKGGPRSGAAGDAYGEAMRKAYQAVHKLKGGDGWCRDMDAAPKERE